MSETTTITWTDTNTAGVIMDDLVHTLDPEVWDRVDPALVPELDSPEGASTSEDTVAPTPLASLKDSMGRFRTRSLFTEHRNPKYSAPFTLGDVHTAEALSFGREFVSIGDPTEYTQALSMLGSWKHWETLTACTWIQANLERWRAELRAKLDAEAVATARDIMVKAPGTPAALSAAKWLTANYAKADPVKLKRGRPSNEEKDQLLKEIAEDERDIKEDAKRLGVKY